LLDLELITRPAYLAFSKAYNQAAARKAKRSDEISFYLTLSARLGKRFPSTVSCAARERRLPYHIAYQLTGLGDCGFDQFGRGVRSLLNPIATSCQFLSRR
jgi:hypothetical protein